MMRRHRDAPLETVLDPNTWASTEALAFAVPSPDGTRVAFGKAVGSLHGAIIHVLDVETGRLLPDRPRARATRRWRGGPTRPGSSTRRARTPARWLRATRTTGTPSTSTGSGRACRRARCSATTR
ncbi:hypothetical protein [Corallococcus sp. 4LFB]|uniref:hypothetical protein n=1 Tax=Corallococcus sp. 4LFB TaxID=3383249 RepID=UPI003975F5B0